MDDKTQQEGGWSACRSLGRGKRLVQESHGYWGNTGTIEHQSGEVSYAAHHLFKIQLFDPLIPFVPLEVPR